MTLYPTAFEGYEAGELVFTVECQDSIASKVVIKQLVNVASWDEISAAIRSALMQMHGEPRK